MIRTPPTMSVAHGQLLTFELPFVPKPKGSLLWLLFHLIWSGFLAWWLLHVPAIWLISSLSGERLSIGPLVFLLPYTVLALFLLSLAAELIIQTAYAAFSKTPVLEIRPEGLVDRHILRRPVRWDEFEPVGERQHVVGGLGRATEYSFRLKDRRLRRLSPSSAAQSLFLGGKRVAIHTYGFDVPPRVILDVILAMIRNAHRTGEAGPASA